MVSGGKIIFQNPDTSETYVFEDLENKKIKIRTIANIIINKFNLKTPPIFFTIYKDNPTENQYLEEDDNLYEVIENQLDPTIPIWWRSPELDSSTIYELRTDRFNQSGYKLDIISKKKIMIVGVGLLGSEIALHCATIGFKNLIVLDYGSVDWFNIFRQPLFNKEDVFKQKVEVAKKKLEEMGGITVEMIDREIPNFNSLKTNKEEIIQTIDIIENAISTSDYIITSLDTFSARMIIQILSLVHNKPLINTAAGLIGGVLQIIRPKLDPCIGCGTFFDRSQETGACTLASFGTPKIIAGLCIDILLDLAEDREINFNYLKYMPNYTIEKKIFHTSDDCLFCGENGISAEYRDGNKNKLLNWLFESK